ncbi:Cytoskeleton protein RodZ [Saliniradius amylolyticus]|uniref:Cytoskeleton protein RodZ n=1 Tax=Saliniradius amylolyticus TaxID=2183582 RepID=A0A2S2E4W7_9ALTE|nr:RodZ domain-containing protein [Saliniradius amylolyticus]AWL12701.1 Cytoskeleton protein RodZ [Saliniradius amylolyticus]
MTDEQTTEQAPQLGLRLKQAREAKGLTVEEVAERLNLRVVNIEEIEAERFDTQVSTTFTRGYVKQYAKLVDVPEDEAVAALDELNAVKPEPTKLHSFSRKVSRQASDDRLMLLSYAILAVIIGLVVLWWLQQSNEGKTVGSALPDSLLTSETETAQDNTRLESQSQPAEPTVNQSEEQVEQSRPEPVELTRVEAEPSDTETMTEPATSEAGDSTMGEVPVNQVEPDSEPESQSSLNASQPEQSAGQEEPEPVEEQAASPLAQENTQQVDNEDAPADESVVDGPVVEAVFEFSGDCWVNIVDATGEAIAYGIKKAGRTMPVSGVAPFEVTLGAPETVTVSFDGEPVDMSDFRAGRTARFTLPRQ